MIALVGFQVSGDHRWPVARLSAVLSPAGCSQCSYRTSKYICVIRGPNVLEKASCSCPEVHRIPTSFLDFMNSGLNTDS